MGSGWGVSLGSNIGHYILVPLNEQQRMRCKTAREWSSETFD